MTVLGGFSSFFGPIVGALALTLLQDQLQSYTQYWRFVLGAILAASSSSSRVAWRAWPRRSARASPDAKRRRVMSSPRSSHSRRVFASPYDEGKAFVMLTGRMVRPRFGPAIADIPRIRRPGQIAGRTWWG